MDRAGYLSSCRLGGPGVLSPPRLMKQPAERSPCLTQECPHIRASRHPCQHHRPGRHPHPINDDSSNIVAQMTASTSAGKHGTPEDIAAAVAWILS